MIDETKFKVISRIEYAHLPNQTRHAEVTYRNEETGEEFIKIISHEELREERKNRFSEVDVGPWNNWTKS